MIKIIHMGAYNANIGDNIAILNARKGIQKHYNKEIEWTSFDIQEFHAFGNATPIAVNIFKKINESINNKILI